MVALHHGYVKNVEQAEVLNWPPWNVAAMGQRNEANEGENIVSWRRQNQKYSLVGVWLSHH